MDRFEIAAAYRIVAARWHSGQNSRGYAILSRCARMGLRLSPLAFRRGSDERRAAAALVRARRAEIRRTW